ncbi:hypothetical protein M3Y95_00361900 [Aphelenchoides besseyi]|nr:hypothetical protein M3Y95_00361900 [Aphelenchoides besseyi]
MRLFLVYGFLVSVLFVVVLAKYEKNVDVHSNKHLLQDISSYNGPFIKCYCYNNHCLGLLQDCPGMSCYQLYDLSEELLRSGCYLERRRNGWIQSYRFLWQFCNTDECNAELPP